jgi:predicted lipoprotein with Yx(FWY)xxD motif
MRKTSITLLAALAAVAAATTALAAGRPQRVVHTARNARLGETILVTTTGRTLYTLSVERRGHFVCADAKCLSVWPPLIVKAGVTPTGAAELSVVRRPDGRRQVTYRGRPLYRFAGDKARGEANGEGLEDVGVWHAAAVGDAGGTATSTAPTTTTTTTTTITTTTTGGTGGYGGY